jgi:hypothetical protein
MYTERLYRIGFEAITAVSMKGTLFLDFIQCSLVEVDQFFSEDYTASIVRVENKLSKQRSFGSAGQHGVRSLKIVLFKL